MWTALDEGPEVVRELRSVDDDALIVCERTTQVGEIGWRQAVETFEHRIYCGNVYDDLIL